MAVGSVSPIDLARSALARGEEDQALPVVAAAARAAKTDAALWQWTGLLHRAIDDRVAALRAFAKARALAPSDALIAHGEARTLLEAGRPAVSAFERARELAPADPAVALGLAAARAADGEAARAASDMEALLQAFPGWGEGHRNLAHLRWTMGEGDRFDRSYKEALARHPQDPALWREWIALLVKAEKHDAVLSAIRAARGQIGDQAFLVANEAVALSEKRQDDAADAAFARLSQVADSAVAVRHVRHLLRTGRVDAARTLGERWLSHPDAASMWPYIDLAWRLLGDPRWEWLSGDPRLVATYDLSADIPDRDALGLLLRRLHTAREQQYDQSVRGGTQTEGALLQRVDPEIASLRRAIVKAVERHVAQLPPTDPRHPVLSLPRGRPVRFAGSWSVKLRGGGHHSNHVHPAGWFSSALHVALPMEMDTGATRAGWLSVGAPQTELGLSLDPVRWVRPRLLHLALFPSIAWHGTKPFVAGERLTVAFDVARPVP